VEVAQAVCKILGYWAYDQACTHALSHSRTAR